MSTEKSLKERFDECAENAKKSLTDTSDDDLLVLYSMYKQATLGDCTTTRPGFFDFVGKKKWDTWDGIKGKSKDDAMKEYIDKVDELIKTSE